MDEINTINTRTKLTDRTNKIYKLRGKLVFYKVEKESMVYNLSVVDSNMPNIISEMLIEFL